MIDIINIFIVIIVIIITIIIIAVKYRFIEFFVFDCDSLPYLFFVFWWGVTFPLVALDKISWDYYMNSGCYNVFGYKVLLLP